MRPILDEVVELYPNDVIVYFKHFPLSSHENSMPAARAAIAAQRQGKFNAMHTMLLENQDHQSIKDILIYADRIGLDMVQFQIDFNARSVVGQAETVKQEGIAAGVQGTPTIYLNGQEYTDPLGLPFLRDWIDEDLAVNR